jgi:predicted ATPase
MSSMLEAVSVGGFKSYGEPQRLPLATLTVLIGANASGKSNLLEALQLLSWLAHGRRLSDLSHAMQKREIALRGRIVDLARAPGTPIVLSCEVAPEHRLRLELRVDAPGLRIVDEWLDVPGSTSSGLAYYWVDGVASEHGSEIPVAYNNFSRGHNKPHISCIDQQAIFTQLITPARFESYHLEAQQRIPAAASKVQGALSSVLFLDPRPAEMRGYSYQDETVLRGDGSNLSSVLRHVCDVLGRKAEVLEFVRALPEQDIEGIEFLSTPRNEVMLSLVESFGGVKTPRDAAVLSDGTLRALAVAAAILSVPEGTLVVIEEIDNGVHPSRARLLMSLLTRHAAQRRIRVVLTTHNPALLDEVPDTALPDTVACFRDRATGESRLVRLADMDEFAALVAQGSLGWLAKSGVLERYLKDAKSTSQRAAEAQQTLELLRKPAV